MWADGAIHHALLYSWNWVQECLCDRGTHVQHVGWWSNPSRPPVLIELSTGVPLWSRHSCWGGTKDVVNGEGATPYTTSIVPPISRSEAPVSQTWDHPQPPKIFHWNNQGSSNEVQYNQHFQNLVLTLPLSLGDGGVALHPHDANLGLAVTEDVSLFLFRFPNISEINPKSTNSTNST